MCRIGDSGEWRSDNGCTHAKLATGDDDEDDDDDEVRRSASKTRMLADF